MSHFDMKKTAWKILTLVLTVAAFGWSLPAHGKRIKRRPSAVSRDVMRLQKPVSTAFSAELISSYNYVKSTEKPFDMVQLVPTDLSPTSDSSAVLSQVADRSLSTLLNSSEMRATPIGRTATSVEQKMKQEVVVSGGGPVQHKFTFQVQAFQAIARVDYKGFANASLKYKASESSLALEIWEKVTRTRDLVVSHISKPQDRVSSVGMRWNF
jgi:hypothetical protein